MALRRGGRFRARHPKRTHAEARQCGFHPLPSIPDFAEYAAAYPGNVAGQQAALPRMHSPLSIRKREVGITELGETHARSIFETDPAATDITDTIQARRYKNRGCPPPRTSAPRIERWRPRCTYYAHKGQRRRGSDPPKDPGCRPRRRGD